MYHWVRCWWRHVSAGQYRNLGENHIPGKIPAFGIWWLGKRLLSPLQFGVVACYWQAQAAWVKVLLSSLVTRDIPRGVCNPGSRHSSPSWCSGGNQDQTDSYVCRVLESPLVCLSSSPWPNVPRLWACHAGFYSWVYKWEKGRSLLSIQTDAETGRWEVPRHTLAGWNSYGYSKINNMKWSCKINVHRGTCS